MGAIGNGAVDEKTGSWERWAIEAFADWQYGSFICPQWRSLAEY